MVTQQINTKKIETVANEKLRWLVGNCSCTLVIGKDICAPWGLDSASEVIVEKRKEGLLIRKVET